METKQCYLSKSINSSSYYVSKLRQTTKKFHTIYRFNGFSFPSINRPLNKYALHLLTLPSPTSMLPVNICTPHAACATGSSVSTGWVTTVSLGFFTIWYGGCVVVTVSVVVIVGVVVAEDDEQLQNEQVYKIYYGFYMLTLQFWCENATHGVNHHVRALCCKQVQQFQIQSDWNQPYYSFVFLPTNTSG